jgi:hypothetical protein
MIQTIVRDLRYAGRQLRNSPSFTVAAVLTLALGVGATTAIFSCVYGLLLKSLPFEDADRLVAMRETHPQLKGGIEATYPDYQDWQRPSFADYSVRARTYSSSQRPTSIVKLGRWICTGHQEPIHRFTHSGMALEIEMPAPELTPLAAR